ncbi:hypothetical protein EV356DRAFT_571523 [Viridothelium virens]|uniref:SMP domain-containing protein n=1 Tax=Viridothelium virens TaxID=1048519 RepID=A0A6A6GTI6_VIRVR|nr:hypothetical protein EV356DRAFT_571523 [Viridothelium virens]
MATQSTGEAISDTMKQEGGPTKGSTAAQMQSQVAKQRNAEAAEDQVASKLETGEPIDPSEARTVQSREQRAMDGQRPPPGSIAAQAQSIADKEKNFEQAAEEVTGKMATAPEEVTSSDAQYLQSREARVVGGDNVPSDSLASDAQRVASANEQGGTSIGRGGLDPAAQSHMQKEQNFRDVVNTVGTKMANDPEQVTKDDANLLHSREQRAHGHTDKGGITAQAQQLAAENEGKTSSR